MTSITEKHAMHLFAQTIGEIVGTRSEAYRDLMRAVESQEMVDLMLAQSSFDSLPPETRREIADKVERLVQEESDDAQANS